MPLYVLYPPRGAPPVILPQILTEQRLLDELTRAGRANGRRPDVKPRGNQGKARGRKILFL